MELAFRRPPGPGKEQDDAEFKLVDQAGKWLTNIRLGVPDWKPGDRIRRGPGDTLEVVAVRAGEEKPVLVVRSGRGENSD